MRVLVLLGIWALLLALVEHDMARDRAIRRRAFVKMRATVNQEQQG